MSFRDYYADLLKSFGPDPGARGVYRTGAKAPASLRPTGVPGVHQTGSTGIGSRGGRYHMGPSGPVYDRQDTGVHTPSANPYFHGEKGAENLARAHAGGRRFALHQKLATLAGAVPHPDHFGQLPTRAKEHFHRAAQVLEPHKHTIGLTAEIGTRAALAYGKARTSGHEPAEARKHALKQVHADLHTVVKHVAKVHGVEPHQVYGHLAHEMAHGIAHTVRGAGQRVTNHPEARAWGHAAKDVGGIYADMARHPVRETKEIARTAAGGFKEWGAEAGAAAHHAGTHLHKLAQKVDLSSAEKVKAHLGEHLGGVLPARRG